MWEHGKHSCEQLLRASGAEYVGLALHALVASTSAIGIGRHSATGRSRARRVPPLRKGFVRPQQTSEEESTGPFHY
jgi:hypothetical protein